MFTGIIEELGVVKSIGNSLTIGTKNILSDIKIGDSIAVNGICLTVTSFDSSCFCVDAMPETYRKTSLINIKKNDFVNLERAMPANGRFGGHIVSGHIDGTGNITDISAEGNAIWFSISTTAEITKYIVQKGSITIDGISLTIAEVGNKNFKVSIIPHTISQTTLSHKKVGDIVNIENDIIAKYIYKFTTATNESSIDMDFLTRCGF